MAELFERFEVERDPRWPRLSRLLVASLVLHTLFLVAVAYVPALQDLFSVAGSFAGIKVVEKDYDRSLIGQRAMLINLKEPYQKLYYPSDYFGAPPEAVIAPIAPEAMVVQEVRPAAPPPVVMRSRGNRRPKAIPTPTPEPSPSPSPEATPETAKTEAQKAEEELNRIAQENNTPRPPAEDELNIAPLKDVLKTAKEMTGDGRIDLNAAIEMTAEADRREDGKLENAVFSQPTGNNQNLVDLGRQFVTALGASGVLKFLKDTRHLKMTLKIDQQTVIINVMTEAETEARARQIANSYGLMLGIVRGGKKNEPIGKVYESMKIDRDGKNVVMSFEMPRSQASELLGKVKIES